MERKIIDYVCKYCGNDKSYVNIDYASEGGECTRCHKMTFYKRTNFSQDIPQMNSVNLVNCPHCNSIDVKKISNASKVGSIALWGVFAAGKVSKQWHCNNCKSDF